MLFTVMVGLGQEYLPKLAVELGLSDAAVGLIVPLPMLLAALVQQASPFLVMPLGGYRRFVAWTAGWQALTFVPLVGLCLAAPWLRASVEPEMRAVVLYLMVTLFWSGAMLGAPAWMAQVGMMIPARILPRYFGRRTVLLNLTLLLSLLGGGWLLRQASGTGSVLGQVPVHVMLAVMFTLAGLARVGSAYYLSRYSEIAHAPPPTIVPPGQLIERLGKTHDGRAMTFMLAMQAAMWLSFPFFSPYMLRQIPVADEQERTMVFGGLLAAFFFGKMIAPELTGRLITRVGVIPASWIASVMLVPVPLLWLVSDSLAWLIAAQVFSGAALASYELCTMMLQLAHVRERERASVLAQFFLAIQAAGLGGAMAGGLLLGGSPERDQYAAAFGVSAAARAACLLLLLRLSGSGSRRRVMVRGEPTTGEGIASDRLAPRRVQD